MKEQIYSLLNKYPDLHYNEGLEEIVGILILNHMYKNEQIIGSYNIRIDLSDWINSGLPVAYEVGNKIPIDYSHVYKDGKLCLATDVEQKIFFAENGNLVDWYREFVIPYFFSLEFFTKYGKYPNGDRSHSKLGVLETYFDIFDTNEISELAKLFKYILHSTYRGHNLCPCNSGKKIRNCHGMQIRKWKEDKYMQILQEDMKYLMSG